MLLGREGLLSSPYKDGIEEFQAPDIDKANYRMKTMLRSGPPSPKGPAQAPTQEGNPLRRVSPTVHHASFYTYEDDDEDLDEDLPMFSRQSPLFNALCVVVLVFALSVAVIVPLSMLDARRGLSQDASLSANLTCSRGDPTCGRESLSLSAALKAPVTKSVRKRVPTKFAADPIIHQAIGPVFEEPDASLLQDFDFSASLDLRLGSKLGVDVDDETLAVDKIYEDGPVHKYNAEMPVEWKRVKVGDRFVSVNWNKVSTMQEVADELARSPRWVRIIFRAKESAEVLRQRRCAMATRLRHRDCLPLFQQRLRNASAKNSSAALEDSATPLQVLGLICLMVFATMAVVCAMLGPILCADI